MKNSSVVILSSKTPLKKLEEAFETISDLAEEELWISVELINGSNSFWAETPEDEISEEEITGIIDVGDDQECFKKIISLAHEIGHVLHHRDKFFKNVRPTMFSESVAWFLGYKWCAKKGFVINMDEYSEFMNECLNLYHLELE